MNILILGMVMFFGIHLLPMTPLAGQLKKRLGAAPYKIVFSLIALTGLAVMVAGFKMTLSGPDTARIVYDPPLWGNAGAPDWHRYVIYALVFAALVAIGASHGRGHIKKFLRQPMSAGVAMWAIGHLLANGNLSEVLLFGGFLVYALLDIVMANARGQVPTHEPRITSDLLAVIAGAVLFIVIMNFHFTLFGVTVL